MRFENGPPGINLKKPIQKNYMYFFKPDRVMETLPYPARIT